jgi:hypothetical protein
MDQQAGVGFSSKNADSTRRLTRPHGLTKQLAAAGSIAAVN